MSSTNCWKTEKHADETLSITFWHSSRNYYIDVQSITLKGQYDRLEMNSVFAGIPVISNAQILSLLPSHVQACSNQLCIICDWLVSGIYSSCSLTLAIHALSTSTDILSSHPASCCCCFRLQAVARSSYEGFHCFKYGDWAKDCRSVFWLGGHSHQSCYNKKHSY